MTSKKAEGQSARTILSNVYSSTVVANYPSRLVVLIQAHAILSVARRDQDLLPRCGAPPKMGKNRFSVRSLWWLLRVHRRAGGAVGRDAEGNDVVQADVRP